MKTSTQPTGRSFAGAPETSARRLDRRAFTGGLAGVPGGDRRLEGGDLRTRPRPEPSSGGSRGR